MFAMENGLINALQAADCATNEKYRICMGTSPESWLQKGTNY